MSEVRFGIGCVCVCVCVYIYRLEIPTLFFFRSCFLWAFFFRRSFGGEHGRSAEWDPARKAFRWSRAAEANRFLWLVKERLSTTERVQSTSLECGGHCFESQLCPSIQNVINNATVMSPVPAPILICLIIGDHRMKFAFNSSRLSAYPLDNRSILRTFTWFQFEFRPIILLWNRMLAMLASLPF
jgi:hypothetical protein